MEYRLEHPAVKDTSTPVGTVLFVDRVAVAFVFAVMAALVAIAVLTVPAAWSDGEPWVAVLIAVFGAISLAGAVRCPFVGLRVTPDQVVVRTLVRTNRSALDDVLDVRVIESRDDEYPAVVLRSGDTIKIVMLGKGNIWPEFRSSGAKWDKPLSDARQLINTRQARG
jgi:hypothetical protein